MRKSMFATTLLGMSIASSSFATTQIEWWHAMGGANGEKLNEIVKEFNDSQSNYEVDPVFKGNYTETILLLLLPFVRISNLPLCRCLKWVRRL